MNSSRGFEKLPSYHSHEGMATRVLISLHRHRREGRSIEFYFLLASGRGETIIRREGRRIEYYSSTTSVVGN